MIPSRRSRCLQLGIAGCLTIGGAIASSWDCAFAQLNLTPDTAPQSNLGTQVEALTPLVDQIQGGTQQDSNLFHSFREFNVPEGRSVYFENPAGVTNILSRVTGNNLSNILGTLGVGTPGALGTANLFLINPHGIIFGANARLDIGGSFVGTTANAIAFDNQGIFSASQPNIPSLLTINPSAFLFNQIAAQPSNSIEVRGFLSVSENQSLLLVGGNIAPTAASTGGLLLDGGRLRAPGGRVELSGVAGTGTVGLNVDGNTLSLSSADNVARSDVTLINDADVNVRAQAGGTIAVSAQNLSLLQGSELFAGIASGLGSLDSRAGDIEINATGAVTLNRGSSIENTVQPEAQGEAGDIRLIANSLQAREGALFTTSVLGQGTAGNAIINAETVSFDGDAAGSPDFKASGVYTRVESDTPSLGGSINITAGTLSVTNGAVLTTSTSGTGNGGSVTIIADTVSLDGKGNFNGSFRQSSGVFSAVKETGVGSGGRIEITAGTLSLTNGGVLITSTLGQGNAGDVIINADTISFDGEGPSNPEFQFSGAYSQVEDFQTALGQGGRIEITARTLSLTNGAVVTTSTLGEGDAGNVIIKEADLVFLDGQSQDGSPSRIFASTEGSGNAGELTINTGRLVVQNGAQVSADTSGTGSAGTLQVNASESVEVIGTSVDGQSASGLYFDTVGTGSAGDAGDLRIDARRLVVQDGARVSARTSNVGRAGTLLVNASESVEVTGTSANGQLVSGLYFDTSSTGDARGIRIETGQLLVQDEGQVIVSSTGAGASGDLEIVADSILLNNKGKLQTTTASGEGGNIRLQVQDLIQMRDNSEISASAEGLGNGGNVEIEASNGFVLAFLPENSDIVASAEQGNGGNASATAAGVFGFRQFRDRRTPESDFTASSELGIDGTLEINTQDRQFEELPADFLEAEIAQGCQAATRQQESRFVITGRGGLPPNPGEVISSEQVQVNLVTLSPREENHFNSTSSSSTRLKPTPIVEPQTWVTNAKGEVVLTAGVPGTSSLFPPSATCPL
ncbi:MAG: S-layer family protein [Microcoleus sp. SIO2G3]|nr:S-layer family protein [Microcoleus sp. SIO2G3]